MKNYENNSVILRRLRWLSVLFPVTFVILFEWVHYMVLGSVLSVWVELLFTLVVLLTTSHFFYRWIFNFVNRQTKEIQQHSKRTQALLEIAQAINSSVNVKDILQQAVDLTREYIGASHGEMHFLRKNGRVEEHGVRFSGLTLGSCPVISRPTLEGLNGEVLRTKKAIRLTDRSKHPSTIGKLPEGHLPIGAFIGVPVIIRGIANADLLLIRTPEAPPFTQEDEDFLQIVAHQTAVAIENAKLYEDVYHIAALEERDRLAHEMHDGFAQTLGYLNLRLKAAIDQLNNHNNNPAQKILVEVRQVVQETYKEVRWTIFDLRSGPEKDLEFFPALEKYINEFGLHANIETELVISDKQDLIFSPNVEVQLTRILQEALTNVNKHAQAKNALISFERNGKECIITVEDDGIGFYQKDELQYNRPHFGIQTMRERAESIGGKLSIENRKQQGTRVIVRIELDHHQERQLASSPRKIA